MKKRITSILVLTCIAAFTSFASAASISNVYDFSDRGWDPVDGVTFEGLTITDDGTLWITSAPNSGTGQLIGAELDFETGTVKEVLSQEEYTNWVTGDGFLGFSSPFNPVALASDGDSLFVGSNGKSSWLNNYVYTSDQSAELTDPFKVTGSACNDPEGAAYLDGAVYLTCQESNKIIKLNDNGTIEDVMSGVTALGLAATETSLIVGDYANHDIFLYDVANGRETERIDLEALFPDYSVEVEPGDIRTVPDPDGLAFYNNKIYMTFEHDLRVYEISLDDPPVATPEPGTLFLIGIGLLGVAGLKKKRS